MTVSYLRSILKFQKPEENFIFTNIYCTYFCQNILILSRDLFDWNFCIGSVTKNDKHFSCPTFCPTTSKFAIGYTVILRNDTVLGTSLTR
jgi:hypothetical protein